MSTLSKVLLGLVIVASIGLAYLGVRAYGTLQNYGKNYQAHVDRLAQLDQQLDDIRPTLAKLKSDLGIALTQRTSGRIWYGKGSLDGDAIKVTVPSGSLPSVNEANGEASLLYVYETWVPEGKPENAESSILRYIGQFNVTFEDPNAAENNVTLTPARALSAEDQAVLADSVAREGVRWIMYEEMPADNYAIFANLTDEEIAALFPEPAPNPDPAQEALDAEFAASVYQFQHDRQAVVEQDSPTDSRIKADPPSNVYVSFRFTKNFDDLTADERDHLQDALSPRQEAGEDVRELTLEDLQGLVVKDKYVRFDLETANKLSAPDKPAVAVVESPVDENGNKEPERIYRRDLRDYQRIYRTSDLDIVELESRVRAAKFDAEKLAESVATLQADVERSAAALRDENAELAHTEEEKNLASQTVNEMQSQLDDMLSKIASLKDENSRLAEELRVAQRAEAEAINNRTKAAAQPVSISK